MSSPFASSRGLLLALLCLLLGGCLGTSYPLWKPQESETVPGITGTWHFDAKQSISIRDRREGGYDVTRSEGGPATTVLLAPLQGNYHIAQMHDPEVNGWYYGIVQVTSDRLVLRGIDEAGPMENRARSHGIEMAGRPGWKSQYADMRILTKHDVKAFFQDVIATNAWSTSPFGTLAVTRTPPKMRESAPRSEAPAPFPAPEATRTQTTPHAEPKRAPLKDIGVQPTAKRRTFDANTPGQP